MSKERLEELSYHVAATSDGRVIMSGEDYAFLYEYALEQAERVQELERKHKRYREVFKEIKETLANYNRPDIDIDTFNTMNHIDILCHEALEGESEWVTHKK